MYRRNNEINYEQVANFLKASVQQVKTQEDVDVLKQLKKVFKKNIPWNLRGYVSAYLLRWRLETPAVRLFRAVTLSATDSAASAMIFLVHEMTSVETIRARKMPRAKNDERRTQGWKSIRASPPRFLSALDETAVFFRATCLAF